MPSVPHAVQMPCLGRPFQLGMLYDCRDDRLIPGVTLWDHSALQNALDSRPHEGLQFSFVAEDTMENKSTILEVDAGLKLSLLGGLVSVTGSAKFLDDQRISMQQARVSLKYSKTSRFEQLTMEHLAVDKVQHPNIFENGDATHVVTAVLYGAEAFFVFDRAVSRNEKYRDIHRKMVMMIKKLPSISIEGDGKLGMNDTEKCEVNRFQCQFHGDIVLPENPTTFQEAVKIYKQLPQLMMGDDNCPKVVPKKVWLYPLCKLDSRAAKIVREISIGLVTQTQKLFQDLEELRMRATDLQKSDVYTNFSGIQKQLSHFTEMISEYKTGIAKRVSTILPHIRGGGAEETKLAEVFEQHHSTVFDQHSLSSWLQGKEQEEKVLKQYLTGLQCDGVQFAFSPGDLDAIITDLDIEHVLCFAFKVAKSCNPFLEAMYSYLLTSETSHENAQSISKHWYQDKALINDIKTKARTFKSFANVNKESEAMKFIVTDLSEELDSDSPEEGADILLYSGGPPEQYEPPSQPGTPKSSSTTHDSIQLTWSKPQYGSQNIQSYTVLYQQESDSPDQWNEQSSIHGESTTLDNLNAETAYHFKVRAHCEIGVSSDSKRSDPIKTEKSPHLRLAIAFKEASQRIEHSTEGLEIYKLPLTVIARQKSKGIAKCCVGHSHHLSAQNPEKVLMVVGATGSGKSTLINGMANYILGVQWNDNFRFKLISNEVEQSQAFSQTQSITSYSFPHFEGSPLQCQITVVDTPGFGDTRGMERDEEITAQIKDFFSLKGAAGIDHIDGVGFVAQSPSGRLTPTQKYIIDSILSVFGKDIASNIFMMITFCDGADPPVMGAISTHIETCQSSIPLVAENLKYFKFNNSALFNKPTSTSATGKGFDEMYWDVGFTSFSDFFHNLRSVQPQSLCLTRTVLDEREKLQTLIQGIQEDIRRGMARIDEMRQEKRVVEKNEAKIKANKDFTYVVNQTVGKKVPLGSGTYVTNCLKCNRTCHFPCGIPKDEDKRGCWAMDSAGNCRICDGHCYWTPHHVNNQFRYEDVMVPVTKHYADLEKEYNDAKKGKASAENMIKGIKVKVEDTFHKVCKDISRTRECLDLLEQIALKPNPLTEVQYIDLLIKSETNGATPGWEKRVKCYEKAREMAVIMADVKKGELSRHMNLEALMDDLLQDVPDQKRRKQGWFSWFSSS